MEIDTGLSVSLAQSPYTLPLKHYDWVRKEIETLEKAGIIQQSLSPWASPVIVVLKKSAPDEPPRRRLCVDFRTVLLCARHFCKAYDSRSIKLKIIKCINL